MPILVYFQSKPWVKKWDNQCILINKHHICSLNAKLGEKMFLCIWKSLNQLLSNFRINFVVKWQLSLGMQDSKDTFRMKTGDTF